MDILFSAKLTVQIVMTQDYPAVAPLFLVSLQWQTERSSLNDINIQVNIRKLFFFVLGNFLSINSITGLSAQMSIKFKCQ